MTAGVGLWPGCAGGDGDVIVEIDSRAKNEAATKPAGAASADVA